MQLNEDIKNTNLTVRHEHFSSSPHGPGCQHTQWCTEDYSLVLPLLRLLDFLQYVLLHETLRS